MTSSSDPTAKAVVGFQAGWALMFRKDDGRGFPDTKSEPLRLTHTDYPAEIRVDADDTLRGATFTVSVDGMRDDDYDAIAAGLHAHLEIRLGWWDLKRGFVTSALAAIGAPMPGGTGEDDGFSQVLEGRVLAVERSRAEFTYRARFEGIDAAYYRMQCRHPRLDTKVRNTTVVDYARELCQRDAEVGVPVLGEGPDTPVDGPLDIRADGSVVQALKDLARLAHDGDTRAEVPMFLRAGRLHVGRWTKPVGARNTWELTPATGLVESRPVVERDPDAVSLGSPFDAPEVRRFDLTLLGRPDIGVGDMVSADLPVPAPASMTGTLAHSAIGPLGDAVSGAGRGLGAAGPFQNPEEYGVVGVHHLLSAAEGFVTRLTVERRTGDERRAVGPRPGSCDEAAKFAASLAEQRRRAALDRRTHEVGLVRRQDVAQTFRDGHDVAAQTLCIDEGLAETPSPNVPSKADPAKTPTQLVGKPYLTPYAFGGTGLVVPHYPGMRVVSLHYREEPQNAVAAGALWESGKAPRSHLGDWWLSLPTNLAGSGIESGSAGDPATAPQPRDEASHDLVSGQGNRVIEVRGLRISIGKALMTKVGTRPADAASDQVVIESAAAKSRIAIDSSGNIEISTDADLTLAANKITLRTKSTVEVV
ncbi:hypothetical protein [Streptomyces spiralis]|uniref:hypothetical protein n=1 Tax=Streptomyces spiralis TaxID=66376 RepID=UPI00369559FA